MAVRTVTESVVPVSGPPPNLAELEAKLAAFRTRFPGVIVDRYLDRVPRAGERVLVSPGVALVGDVELGDDVSIWYGSVLRGDVNRIVVGDRSNLQDGTVVHLGQATILDGATIGEGSVVGAGALVTAGTVVPPRSLVLGSPARVIRTLGDDAEAFHVALAAKYVRLQTNYRAG
jgi:carbonic anhydrase/acetyltransferase-like protein (isoleucine patch superfamily)